MPLESAVWASLNSETSLRTIGAVLQLPFAISALGIYHTKAVGRRSLTLSCTLLARLYTGAVTSWKDAGLLTLNDGTRADQSFTGNITVFAMAAPSAATYALTAYLAKVCKDDWTVSTGPVTNVSAWAPNVNTTFQVRGSAGTVRA
jgi:ABC-type phosphate transport system substrate-binding protein